MNTYYLKKFREEAQKRVKAKYMPTHLDDKFPYVCEENERYIDDSVSKDLLEVQQKLSGYRRNYILMLTQAERKEKLNKQLAKL